MEKLEKYLNRPVLWLAAFFLITGYLLMRMPLPTYFLASLDARKFFPSLTQGVLFVLLIAGLFFAYGQLLNLIRRGKWRPSIGQILAISLGLFVLMALIYPFNANDIYRYVLRGRITAAFGGNPFSEPISAFPAIPLINMAGEWINHTSPYGPLWELLAVAPVALGFDRPLVQLLGFKTLTGAAFLATGWLIYRARRQDGESGLLPAAVWLLNPALLLIFGADGHNDVVMILFLVGGWLTLQRGVAAQKWGGVVIGGIILWLAVMIKAIALLPLPLIAIYVWRAFPSSSERLKIGVSTVLGIVGTTFLLFLPFGNPLDLVTRLVNEASAGVSFTPITLAILLQQRFGDVTMPFWEAVSLWGIVIGALWVGWRVWRGRSPLQGAADLFMIYLLLAFNFRLWYTAWPFPFLLLDPKTSRTRLTAGHMFLFVGQLSVFVFGHLWAEMFDREPLITYLFGIPLLFVVPIAAAYLGNRIGEIRNTKYE